MWRQDEHDARRAADRFPVLVVGVFCLGALIAAVVAVAFRPATLAFDPASSDGGGSPGGGWAVPTDAPWAGSVVRITTDRCSSPLQGTGVVVGGRVWTNRHVLEGATRVRLTTADGSVLEADGWSTASTVDVAVVDAPSLPGGIEPARAGNATDAVRSTGLEVLGFPGGGDLVRRPTAVTGARSGWGDRDPAAPWELRDTVVPGESGSPVVDGRGRLMGLVYARSEPDGGGLVVSARDAATAISAAVPAAPVAC